MLERLTKCRIDVDGTTHPLSTLHAYRFMLPLYPLNLNDKTFTFKVIDIQVYLKLKCSSEGVD